MDHNKPSRGEPSAVGQGLELPLTFETWKSSAAERIE